MEQCKHGWTVPDEPCPECEPANRGPITRLQKIVSELKWWSETYGTESGAAKHNGVASGDMGACLANVLNTLEADIRTERNN